MEALTAVGLASSILQFISFSTDLLTASKEIYSSAKGSTKKLEELDEVCQCLTELTLALTPETSPEALRQLDPSVRPLEDDIGLVRLSIRCRNTALRIQKGLRPSNPDNEPSKLSKIQSLRLAIKLRLGHHTEQLQQTLGEHHRDLMLYLQVVSVKNESAILKFVAGLKQAKLNVVRDHQIALNKIHDEVRALHVDARLALERKTEFGSSKLLKSIAESLEAIAKASSREWVLESEFVRSLYFEMLPVRHAAIQNAHRDTFEWLLKPRSQNRSEENPKILQAKLLEWLQSGSGIYWISGKPGSGKSTLMKLIANHPRTQEALDEWAGGTYASSEGDGSKACVTAAYYFWSAGTALQRSVEGLLRALLFDILKQVPGLIPIVFPERWATVIGTASYARSHILESAEWKSWSLSELTAALQLLSQAPSPTPYQAVTRRFCFFIDGLDEYHGDHPELLRVLSEMAPMAGETSTIKLCVSSRPWNVFEDSLGVSAAGQKICVHDLTRGDITSYINETLCGDPLWLSEAGAKPEYNRLVEEITNRAQGVFLWVVLVAKSLLEGLSNGDSLKMLERRVNDMPQELGLFFQHILLSVPHEYHRHMAIYFRIALDATNSPVKNSAYSHVTLMHFSFIDDLLDDDNNNFTLPPLQPISDCDVTRRHQIMKRRLNARSKGLLEAYRPPLETQVHLAYHVVPLHRTVHDFMHTVEMANFLDGLAGNTPIELMMLNACVSLLKSLPWNSPFPVRKLLFEQALSYAHKAEHKAALHGGSAAESASQLEVADIIFQAVDDLQITADERGPCDGMALSDDMAFLAVQYGLHGYVSAKIDAIAHGFSDASELLAMALTFAAESDSETVNMLGMIAMLLCKSRLQMGSQSVVSGSQLFCVGDNLWRRYLDKFAKMVRAEARLSDYHKQIFDLILPHVSDVNAKLHLPGGGDVVAWGKLFLAFIDDTADNFQRSAADLRVQILAALFLAGADPNALHSFKGIAHAVPDETIWSILRDKICNSAENRGMNVQRSPIRLECTAMITTILLKAGADTAKYPLPKEAVRSAFPARLASQICCLLPEQQAGTADTSLGETDTPLAKTPVANAESHFALATYFWWVLQYFPT